jgi:hypothetical protein
MFAVSVSSSVLPDFIRTPTFRRWRQLTAGAEGFAPLPRRLDEERPIGVGPTRGAVADVRSFALSTGEFTTKVGGLFLFIPDLIRLNFDALARSAKLPGSRMIPAEYAHQP